MPQYSMIFKDFVKLLLIAFLFSFPVGYYISSKWLENFAYRIGISIWIFALPFIFLFAFSFVLILYQTVKVALLNPVDTLRDE